MPTYAQTQRANARAIARLGDPELRQIASVLGEARRDTAAGLRSWLAKIPVKERDSKYTIFRHRSLLGELDDAMKILEKRLPRATVADLRRESGTATRVGMDQLRKMVAAGMRRFEGAVQPLRVDLAAIVTRTNGMLIRRHERSAARYAGRTGEIVQRQLAVGLVRGESVDEIARRLTGKLHRQYEGLSDAERAAAAGDRVYVRALSDATRLVRTELIHAANVSQMEALKEENDRADDDDSIGGGGWLVKWDAMVDSCCDNCADLDGEVREIGEEFDDGVTEPPLHPNCRCATVPWREDWT